MKRLTPEQLDLIRQAPATTEQPNRVKMAMVLTGTTLRDLHAAILSLSYSQVSMISCGRNNNMKLATARPFAEFFGCSIDDLFPARTDVQSTESTESTRQGAA